MNLGTQLALLEWRAPLWLLLAGLPWLLAALGRLRERPLRRYADRALRPWALYQAGRDTGLRFGLHALAWLLLAAALAGPRVPAPVQVAGEGHRGDVSLMLVLDVSATMQAQDLAPRRLTRALLEVDGMLEGLRGERVGLVAFAGRALMLAPPTHDRRLLSHYLSRGPEALADPAGLSASRAVAEGLRLAGEALEGSGAVVLITDGDARAFAGARLAAMQTQARALRDAGHTLYVLGVGGTEPVPVPDGAGGLLREGGETLLSRLDAEALTRLAEVGGGHYAQAGALGQSSLGRAWERLYADAVVRLPSSRSVTHWQELHPWLLAPGLVLLLLSWLRPAPAPAPASALVLALLLPLQPAPVSADEPALALQAHSAWNAGAFARALNAYARLPGHPGRLGEGASAYRLGDFEHAAEAFIQAWLTAPGDRERAEALFNLGNARFRQEDYAAAVETYRGALAYPSPHRQAIEHNLALAAGREREAGGPGLAGRRARQATEDVGRMDLEETPGFPEDEETPRLPTEEGDREALGEAVARGELEGRAERPAGGPGRRLAVDREYDAALLKQDQLEDRDLRLWRALRDRESPGGGGAP